MSISLASASTLAAAAAAAAAALAADKDRVDLTLGFGSGMTFDASGVVCRITCVSCVSCLAGNTSSPCFFCFNNKKKRVFFKGSRRNLLWQDNFSLF